MDNKVPAVQMRDITKRFGSVLANDKVWLNASSGEVRYLLEENELPRGYVENMVAFVKKKMNMSVDILNTDYYNFVYSNYQRSVG